MLTNSDVISQIRAMNRAENDDSNLSDRKIYWMAKHKASLLLKRKVKSREFLTSDSVYQPLECIELCLVDGTECGCSEQIRRSVDKLPHIEDGFYSYLIQGVFNPSNSQEIFPTTIRDFIIYKKLRIKQDKKYYLLKNEYLYVLDLDVEMVNMYAYFTEDITKDNCLAMADREFRFPSGLLSDLYQMVNADLINYHKIPKDTEDNNRDEV